MPAPPRMFGLKNLAHDFLKYTKIVDDLPWMSGAEKLARKKKIKKAYRLMQEGENWALQQGTEGVSRIRALERYANRLESYEGQMEPVRSKYSELNRLRGITSPEVREATLAGDLPKGGPIAGRRVELKQTLKRHSLSGKRQSHTLPGWYPTRYGALKKLREKLGIPTSYVPKYKHIKVQTEPRSYMKPPSFKPQGKMTKSQWGFLMDRVATRSLQSPDVADRIMQSIPPIEKTYSRVVSPKFNEWGAQVGKNIENLPERHAMLKYAGERRKLIGRYGEEGAGMIETPNMPPADVYNPTEGTFERRLFKNIQQSAEQRSSAAAAVEPEIAPRPVSESITGGGTAKTIQETGTSRLVLQAADGDAIFRTFIRRKNTDAGRMWTRLMEKRQGKKTTGKTAMSVKDYFLRVYLRYMNDPEGARKVYKVESRFLDEYTARYKELQK